MKVLYHCDNQLRSMRCMTKGSTRQPKIMASVHMLYFCAAHFDITEQLKGNLMLARSSLLIHMQIKQKQSTSITIIPATYVSHHAGLPVDQPEMTRMVKVGKIKYMNKYFTYLHPNKCSSCTITSALAVVVSTTPAFMTGVLHI